MAATVTRATTTTTVRVWVRYFSSTKQDRPSMISRGLPESGVLVPGRLSWVPRLAQPIRASTITTSRARGKRAA